jgi:LysM repeat protein
MPRQQTALLRVLVTLSTIVVGVVLLLPSAGNAVDDIETTAIHVVQPGDTLWEIAAASTPAGEDVRDTVEVIKNINELTSSLILPGHRLVVPAVDADVASG